MKNKREQKRNAVNNNVFTKDGCAKAILTEENLWKILADTEFDTDPMPEHVERDKDNEKAGAKSVLSYYFDDIGYVAKKLSKEEEMACIQVLKDPEASFEKRKSAETKLVNAYLCFGIDEAKKYHHSNSKTSLEDIVAMANIGIWKAISEKIQKYNPEYAFSTFVAIYIKESVLEGLGEDQLIRVPKYKRTDANKILKQKTKLESSFGRKVSLREIADEIAGDRNIPVEKMEDVLRQASPNITSLHQPLGEDEKGATVEDTIKDFAPSIEEQCEKMELSYAIHKILSQLPERDRQMILLRFGFIGEECKLKQLAEEYQMSQEGVRKVIKKALSRMLPEAKRAGLDTYLEREIA